MDKYIVGYAKEAIERSRMAWAENYVKHELNKDSEDATKKKIVDATKHNMDEHQKAINMLSDFLKGYKKTTKKK